MRVTMLAPTSQGQGDSNFYAVFVDFMRTAAQQLEIDFEVVECTNDGRVFLERGLEFAARPNPPDYVVFPNFMSTVSELLPALARAGTRAFLVVEGIEGGDRSAMGRESLSAYLGEIIPDDVEAGRVLAEELVEEARRRGMVKADGKLRVGIVAGMQTQVNRQRFQGWKACLDKSPDLLQSGFRYGGQDKGGIVAATALLESAPNTSVLWCFNDALALGAVGAIAKMGRKPGKDVLVGGIDLIEPALTAISQGTMYVSLGGHFVDGVRALLLLDEHHRTGNLTPQTHTSHLEVVKANEAAKFRTFMKDRAWRNADFTRFSTRRNPQGTREELTLRALVNG